MTNQDLKQISNLLDPIRKDLGGLKQDVIDIKRVQDRHTKSLVNLEKVQDQHTKSLVNLEKVQDQHTKSLINLEKVQKQHTESLVEIENTIKIYGDMYDVNRYEARKLEQRIEMAEDELSIEPPAELVLLSF